MYQKSRVNKELKSLMSQFYDSYKSMAEASRSAYMKSLPAGAQIPREGVIYGRAEQDEFLSMCNGYLEKAREILRGVDSDVRAELTKAPSTDAVNTIGLLKMRDRITEDEVGDLLTRYGKDCPQAWKTIVSIARSHDIHAFPDHPVESTLEDVEMMERSIEKTFDGNRAVNGEITPAYLSFMGMEVDRVFPSEE